MKVTIRRIGNSLGIIIPRTTLAAWKLAEGDRLEVTTRGIWPPASARSPDALDEHKLRLAIETASRFPAKLIRAHSLANLHRWKSAGAWVSAYDEWQRILESGSDGELFAALIGRDENSIRLRQSAPYAGLLPREEV